MNYYVTRGGRCRLIISRRIYRATVYARSGRGLTLMTQTAPLLRGGNRFDYIYAALVTALPCCCEGKRQSDSLFVLTNSLKFVYTILEKLRLDFCRIDIMEGSV